MMTPPPPHRARRLLPTILSTLQTLALALLAGLASPAARAEVTVTRLGTCPPHASQAAQTLAVSGNYAYVANSGAGLLVIDVSTPTSPVMTGRYDTSGWALGVAVAGNYAYVGDGNAGLQVIDVSNPATPTRVGGYDTAGMSFGVAVVGSYVYVADYASGLQVIDVGNPISPTRVGGCDTSGQALDVTVVGNYAYVADGDAGLQIVDVSNPASPVCVGGYDTSGNTQIVVVSGHYAYVADYASGWQVIDISVPSAPTLAGGCPFGSSGQAEGVAVSGGYLYGVGGGSTAATSGLRVFDVTNPTNFVQVAGHTYSGSSLLDVEVKENYAYVAANTEGLIVLRIDGATQPATHLVTLRPGDHGSIPGANPDGDYVTHIAAGAAFTPPTPTPHAGWTFTGWNPPVPETIAGDVVATAEYAPVSGPLADAIDLPGGVVTHGGTLPWFSQTTTTHDGVDAAQSGAITDDQESWMETILTGPGTLTFWWKVSSESGCDFLQFYIDGALQGGSISGSVDWTQKTYHLASGMHTVKWRYMKDFMDSNGSDCGWVDQLMVGPPAPEIAVEQPAGTGLIDGSANVAFGNVELGANLTKNFTIRNLGSANLTGLAITMDGTHADDFTVGSLGATDLAPGASTTFTVTFAPLATGAKTAAIHIASDDADENPFDINLTGSGVPVLADAIDLPGAVMTHGGTVPWFSQTTTTHDGVAAAQCGAIIHNQESWMQTTLTGPGILSFWWKVSSQPGYDFLEFYMDGVLQTGRISGSVDWTQESYAIASGTHTVKWRYMKNGWGSSGSDRGWVDQVVFGPPTPEIAVEQPAGTDLIDGSASIGFSVNMGSSSSAYTFTIRNLGTANLTGLAITKDGTNADDFTVGSLGATVLAPGASTTFAVTFAPLVAGAKTAAIHIASDDADEALFDINLTGSGVPVLADAIDLPGAVIIHGEISPWFSQTTTTHDGVAAAQSGTITHNQMSWMQTTLTGSGSLTFWWKVSSESGHDFLEFYMDGALQTGSISGSVDWTQKTYHLASGQHFLSWSYVKDGSGSNGSDCGWVDQVVFVPDPYTYTIANGQVTITGYTGSGGDVVIPATIHDLPITSIGSYAFRDCDQLTSMTIPVGVTSIGDDAFYNCSGLTSVTIPASVTSIGNSAFSDCSGLTSVTIPSGINTIGDGAFYNCSGLTSVTIPASVTSIGNSAFSCCGLTSVTILPGVTSIGSSAFYQCQWLTSVTIPNSVTNIGSSAFSRCGLTSVTILPGVISIGDGAFSECYSLTSVTIPSSVTSIGSSAFRYCSGLTSVTIPASVTSIGNSAFSYCSGLTSVTIPASVTSIMSFAFYNCSGLRSAIFEGNAPTMGSGVFDSTASRFAVHYSSGSTGFTSPTWMGYPAVMVSFVPTVTTSAASAITSTSATLNGTVNPNGGITAAQFEYGLTTAYGNTASVTLSPDNGTTGQTVSASISGLQPGQTYHYRLTASNSGGARSGADMTLVTAVQPLTGFALWASQNNLTGDPATLFSQDRNDDGISNGIEYALGGNLPPGTPLLTIRMVNARPLVETPAQDPATQPYAILRVVGSSDLINWTLPVSPAADTTGKPANRDWFEIQSTLPAKAFFKLEAELK